MVVCFLFSYFVKLYYQIMFEVFRDIDDFDELVFENRNKEYGAYQLRKKYKSAVITGTIISTLLAVIIVVVPFALSLDYGKKLPESLSYYSVVMGDLELPIDMIITPPPPPPPPKGSEIVSEIIKYTPPVIVDSILPAEENFASVDEILFQTTIEHSVLNGTGTGDEMSYGYGFGSGDINDAAFFIVEVMPSFRGGDLNTFREWVQRRIIYPQAAIEARIQGRVSLTFIVETDGSVSNVMVVQGVAAIIDEEVVKAVEASPRWSPGLQQGQPVRIRYSFWLNFIL